MGALVRMDGTPLAGTELIIELAMIDANVSEMLDRDRRQFDLDHAVILDSIARRLANAARRIRLSRPPRRGTLAEAMNSDRA